MRSTRTDEQRRRRHTVLPAVAVLAVALVHLAAGILDESELVRSWDLVPLQSALVAAQAPALLVRRSRPITSATVVVLLHCALLGMSGAELGVGSLAVMISVFHLVRRFPRERAYPAVVGLTLVSSATAFLAALHGGSPGPAGAGALVALRLFGEYLAPAVVAEFASGRDQLAGATREKEVLVQRERTYLLEQERRAERNALARELHDIAGHHLSGIIVSAQAAGALIESDPVRSRSMLRQLEQEARAAMVDLRGTLGLLRSDRAEPDDGGRTAVGSPGLEDVRELVDAASCRGRQVSYLETGEAFRLGPIAETTVYRMVQESLANSARHEPGAASSVSVEYRPEELVVRVENEPGEQPRAPRLAEGKPAGSRGYGITGMSERAELIGAHLSTGPADDGGWRNTLRIPRPLNGAER